MKAKQDKCLNCGASINYKKVEKGVYQCPYCREYYHIDEYGLIEEYKVKLKHRGHIIHCYLECEEYMPSIDTECYIDSSGKFSTYRIGQPEIIFTLRSYKVEDEVNKK